MTDIIVFSKAREFEYLCLVNAPKKMHDTYEPEEVGCTLRAI